MNDIKSHMKRLCLLAASQYADMLRWRPDRLDQTSVSSMIAGAALSMHNVAQAICTDLLHLDGKFTLAGSSSIQDVIDERCKMSGRIFYGFHVLAANISQLP